MFPARAREPVSASSTGFRPGLESVERKFSSGFSEKPVREMAETNRDLVLHSWWAHI